MKIKDILALGLLAVVLIVIGSFLVSKLGRGGQPRTAEVEVVHPIDPGLNEVARNILLGQDTAQPVSNFSVPQNLEQGFGNTNPFRAE